MTWFSAQKGHMMFSSRNRYGWGLIWVHWLTLLMIVATYVMGLVLEDMTLSPLKLQLYAWHKWIGMLVLALVIPRLVLRMIDGLEQARGLTPLEIRLSTAVHGLIYLLMVIAPMFGWLQSSALGFQVVWFGVLPLPDLVSKDKAMGDLLGQMHEVTVNMLLLLVAIHALGAIYHHVVRRDAVLVRMAPWLRKRK